VAAITRRTWAQIETEVQRRLFGIAYTGFSGGGTSRADYFIWQAYKDLCTLYHHPELDVLTSLTFSGTNTLNLPADTFVVVGCRYVDFNTGNITPLTKENFRTLFLRYIPNQFGVPSRYARWGSKLYFDIQGINPNTLDLLYYQLPAAPDLTSSGTPIFSSDCDEHLIDLAVAYAMNWIGRPDLGASGYQTLQDWLAQQVRPSVTEDLLPERREKALTDVDTAGKQ
jgi:hypothetical protein